MNGAISYFRIYTHGLNFHFLSAALPGGNSWPVEAPSTRITSDAFAWFMRDDDALLLLLKANRCI